MLQGVASSNDDGIDGPIHHCDQKSQIPMNTSPACELSRCDRSGLGASVHDPIIFPSWLTGPMRTGKLMTQLAPWHHDSK